MEAPKKEPRVMVGVLVSSEAKNEMKAEADSYGLSLSAFARRLISIGWTHWKKGAR